MSADNPQDRHHRRGDADRGRARGQCRRPGAPRPIAVIEQPLCRQPMSKIWRRLIDDRRRTRRAACRACGRRARRSRPAVESFGKAAAVGADGELEHAAAILHPKLGAPFREVLGKGAALIPSSKKRGGLGAPLDIPLGHKDAAYVRSHFDGMEVRVADAPRADEIVVAIAVTDSGRPHPRVGGLTKDEIKGEDGC